MKYAITHPYLPFVADKILTGNYGEDDYSNHVLYCSCCGESIYPGEEYYDVGGKIFCMRCEGDAEMEILEEVRNQYIYEL